MRRQSLFAVLCHAAVLQGFVLAAFAAQVQTTGQQMQSAGQQSQGPRPPTTTQQPTERKMPAIPSGLRPLTVKEGRAILRKTAWTDDEEGLAPDCSHLVHVLYEQAGYSYPYASSMDLYRGAGHFVRVPMPQPGDLIVWPGHVGIVESPRRHSFFSTTSTGARTANYHSPYWRARGHARFYRYLTSSAAKRSSAPAIAEVKQRDETKPNTPD